MHRTQPEHAPEHSHLDAIERITGYRPTTCPWRAYYDELVREVMEIAWSIEGGNLAAVITENTPAILVEALGVYRSALLATRAEEMRLRSPQKGGKR